MKMVDFFFVLVTCIASMLMQIQSVDHDAGDDGILTYKIVMLMHALRYQ